jgi:hypothetical protein
MHDLAQPFEIFNGSWRTSAAYAHSYARRGLFAQGTLPRPQLLEINKFAPRQKKLHRPLDFAISPKYNADKSHLLRTLGSREVRP